MENQILQYLTWENIPRRFVEFKKNGLLRYDTELFKHFQNAMEGFKNGKNIVLLGGVGRGKSFLAYELAFRIKLLTMQKSDKSDFPIPCYRASQIVSSWKANFSNFEILDKLLQWHSYRNSNFKISVKGLIIDEIDDISPSDYVLLNELIISAYERMIPLIMISNKDTKSFLENFSTKSVSRLNENSLIIRAEGEDLRKSANFVTKSNIL